jgi:hypothetical protein
MLDTAERLLSYYDFDETVLAAGEEVAARQRAMSWQAFLTECGLSEPKRWLVDNQATEVIEFRPSHDFDETQARIFHPPLANSLDPNMAYQAATIFSFDPTTRLIAFANPSGPGRSAGTLKPRDWFRVAAGDFMPLAEPRLKYLAEDGVECAVHIGGSEAAEVVMAAGQHAARFGHQVLHTVAIDPVTVTDRSLPELAKASMDADEHVMPYVEASEVPAFTEAWHVSTRRRDYYLKLLRPTNAATVMGLRHGLFGRRTAEALKANPAMRSTIIWGSESEFALDGLTAQIVAQHQHGFGADRVSGIRLPGQYHAFMNDIHLQAALVLQASRNAAS